ALELAREQQREPAAHRGADDHLRTAAERGKDRAAFLEPAADRAVDERALRFAVARIVEADERAPALVREARQRRRLDALHVRLEAAEPEQPGRRAGERAHREGTRIGALPDLDEPQRLGHRILP